MLFFLSVDFFAVCTSLIFVLIFPESGEGSRGGAAEGAGSSDRKDQSRGGGQGSRRSARKGEGGGGEAAER